ncbi:MAG: arylsulfatase [Candidatus Lokiarchaeota archaeon]|nr:arylsulfatase [Candidatus Lokiarchaeota archaeon]
MAKPNIILILNDDMGYSDLGCYGGEVQTPNLDNLAKNGIRFTNFYNTARCSPSRASLLTGLHPHQTGIGVLVNNDGPEGYAGSLNNKCVTIAEVLREDGYKTYVSGKWHVSNSPYKEADSWPTKRGFDHHYGILQGATDYFYPIKLRRDGKNIEEEARNDPNYYLTDAISDQAVAFLKEHHQNFPEDPYFLYIAYTAPHWPLHAKESDIKKYEGRFIVGWDILREERLQRMKKLGLCDENLKLSERDPTQRAWDLTKNKEWEARRMAVYTAQIDNMDQGIGRIIAEVKKQNQLENTVIVFLSDNGGCAEPMGRAMKKLTNLDEWKSGRIKTKDGRDILYGNRKSVIPGPANTYASYGTAWANLSNTPFRKYKHWVHEGGIATPLIIHWPNGIKFKGKICHQPGQLPDIMATIIEITHSPYPEKYNGDKILPLEGQSLALSFSSTTSIERTLFFEHEGNAAVIQGNWKLVKEYPYSWELYDRESDRTELDNIISRYPVKARELELAFHQWAKRCGVIPWDLYLTNNRFIQY